MKIIRNLRELLHQRPFQHTGCVATIGNFDGVHLGHQAVLQQLAHHAQRLDLPAVVISFEPQPIEFFAPDKAPVRLTRLREKWEVLKQHPADLHLCLKFNAAFANLSAQDFVQQVLLDGLNIKHLIVGDDFRFGKGRSGDFAFLQAMGQQSGFAVNATPSFLLDGERVSSTRIRACLAAHNLTQAAALLGRPYSLSGKIAHGAKLGRTLGFPTLNLHLHRAKAPISGIFAVRVQGLAQDNLAGVASLGVRPTVEGGDPRPLLETHLFDFNDNVYGQFIRVDLLHWLRDEQRFDSLETLTEQMHQDSAQARHLLGQAAPNPKQSPKPATTMNDLACPTS